MSSSFSPAGNLVLGDIRAMLRVSGPDILMDDIERWVDNRQLGREWAQVNQPCQDP